MLAVGRECVAEAKAHSDLSTSRGLAFKALQDPSRPTVMVSTAAASSRSGADLGFQILGHQARGVQGSIAPQYGPAFRMDSPQHQGGAQILMQGQQEIENFGFWPATVTSPEVGWSSPASNPSSVLLPLPEGPSMATERPASKAQDKFSSTVRDSPVGDSKIRDTSRSWIMIQA